MTVTSNPSTAAPGGAGGTGVVRVASVPASHVYVRHLEPTEGPTSVVRLPDPVPDDRRRSPLERWWPPSALDPAWIDAEHGRFDVFHVHFGFDATTAEGLAKTVRALRRHGKPLVYTVHDLRNPHHAGPAEHDRQLDVLVPAADALVTLTDGAADAVAARWGRRPLVVPHPHVVDLPTIARLQAAPVRRDDELRIGVHVKSVRPSMEPLPVLRTIVEELGRLPGAVLQVNGHREVLEPGGARYDAALAEAVAGWAAEGLVDLRVHDFFSDAELWAYLSSLHVSVLPYRFGTHSGWLEACRDLGTAVLAPDCGFYAGQGPVVGYHHDEDGLDAGSLAEALHTVRDLLGAGPWPAVPPEWRASQRAEIAARHEALYRSLLA